MDDGSEEDLRPLAAAFRAGLDLRIERRRHEGVAAARNAGLSLARGPLVVLGEDDIRPLPSLVASCLDFHRRHPREADSVLLRFVPAPHLARDLLMSWLAEQRRGQFSFPPADGVYGWAYFWGGALSTKASLFRHGRFDPRFERLEDTELGLRLADRLDLRIHFEGAPQATSIRGLDVRQLAQREYATAYHRVRLVRDLSGDPRAAVILPSTAPEDHRPLAPEEFATLIAHVGRLERSLKDADPGDAAGAARERLRLLHRLYEAVIAHAQASGHRDALEGRAPGQTPESPGAGLRSRFRAPAVVVRARKERARRLLGIERVLAQAQARLGREPSILDWHTGLRLERAFPGRPVVSPPLHGPALPYVDRSIDLVVRASAQGNRREAARVAGAAIVTLESGAAGDGIRVAWRRLRSAGVAAPTVSVVLVPRDAADARRYLEGLAGTLHGRRPEILVVGPTPGGGRRQPGRHPAERNAIWLRPEPGASEIARRNQGAHRARGEIVVFVGPGIQPRPGWLAPMVEVLGSDPEAAAVGGRLEHRDGRLIEAGIFVFRDGSVARVGEGDREPDAPPYGHVRPVDGCSPALLACRRSLFLAVGGFDPAHAPIEHVHHGLAIRERGYRVMYQPASVAVQEGAPRLAPSRPARGVALGRRWSHLLTRRPERPRHLDRASWERLTAWEA